jgi:PDZ domain-containing secreted protein
MMRFKKISAKVIIVILVVFLFIPIPLHYKDGGTVEYHALLYSVTDFHSMKMEGGYDTGIQVKILEISVYDNTTFDD